MQSPCRNRRSFWAVTALAAWVIMPPGEQAFGAEPHVADAARTKAMWVPDFVRPGARVVYTHTSLIARPERPNERPTADGGTMQHDIVAVLPDRVLARTVAYASTTPGTFFAMNFGASVVTAADVGDLAKGNIIWASPKEIAAFPQGQGITVTQGDFPLGDKSVKAATLRFEGKDSLDIRSYDAQSGLKLFSSLASGPLLNPAIPNGGLNRAFQQSMKLEGTRQLQLPWLGKKFETPAWAKHVIRLRYEGAQQMMQPDAISVRIESLVTIIDRGDDWMVAKIESGAARQAPIESRFAQGPGSIDPHWFSPQLLQTLKLGVLDQDPFLGLTLAFDVRNGPLGQLGVLTQSSAGGKQVRTYGYSLQDGCLVYLKSVRQDFNMVVELQLTGRE